MIDVYNYPLEKRENEWNYQQILEENSVMNLYFKLKICSKEVRMKEQGMMVVCIIILALFKNFIISFHLRSIINCFILINHHHYLINHLLLLNPLSHHLNYLPIITNYLLLLILIILIFMIPLCHSLLNYYYRTFI